MKRANIYKASNVTFNPENFQAYSYDWWRFTDYINGRIVFNTYTYSSSTIKHQSKVRSLLSDLGITGVFKIECPAGLQAPDRDESIREHYQGLIQELEELIAKPRTQAKKNEERRKQIKEYKHILSEWEDVLKR